MNQIHNILQFYNVMFPPNIPTIGYKIEILLLNTI